MKKTRWASCLMALGATAPLLLIGGSVQAQSSGAPSGYQVGDGDVSGPDAGQNGPVRLARFSYVQGNVTWRPDDSADWSPAAVNLPIRQGAQIWVTGGRAEIQFDDGGLLRLGSGAVVTLQTLYSDADGEFTELRLNHGLSSLRLLGAQSVFQIDAPSVSVKAAGPAKIRVGVDNGTEVAVRQGRAAVEGVQHQAQLAAGDYLFARDEASPLDVTALPPADNWDRFDDDRDRQMDEAEHDGGRVPSSVALVAGDLDDYGDWHNDPHYGQVWAPRVTEADWRPYHDGHWVWVEPFGWTWVSTEAWGWAPYHYGTWVNESYGWAWVPGPARQYWCPAVVHFAAYGGQVAWAPLAPAEVHYPPTLSIGFHGHDWSLSFSIGGCAVYRPGGPSWFAPQPWHNVVVNRVTNVTNITKVYNVTKVYNNQTNINNVNITRVNNRAITPLGFGQYDHLVPVNARLADGVSAVRNEDFAGQARFVSLSRAESPSLFAHSRPVLAAGPGRQPLAGPASVRPTLASLTPTRAYLTGIQQPRGVLARPVFRSAVAPQIARAGVQTGTFVAPARPFTARPSTPVSAFRRPDLPRNAPFVGRPAASDGRPAASDGRPAASDGRPRVFTDGRPRVFTDGRPRVFTDGRPRVFTDGRPRALPGSPAPVTPQPLPPPRLPADAAIRARVSLNGTSATGGPRPGPQHENARVFRDDRPRAEKPAEQGRVFVAPVRGPQSEPDIHAPGRVAPGYQTDDPHLYHPAARPSPAAGQRDDHKPAPKTPQTKPRPSQGADPGGRENH